MNLQNWNLYVDGSATPVQTVTNFWQNESLTNFTNFFSLAAPILSNWPTPLPTPGIASFADGQRQDLGI